MGSRYGWRRDRQNNRLEVQVGSEVVAYFPGRGGEFTPQGSAFYVDGTNGSNDYNGLSPQTPKETINAALALCTTDKNDYIFVLRSGDQDEGGAVTSSAIRRIHLIGVGNPQTDIAGVVIPADSAGVDAISCANGAFGYSEIAGLSLGGGATGCGGIGLHQTIGLWVHHCAFGHRFVGDTPAYGIWSAAAANAENCLVEDCFFYGDANNGKGTIAGNGINLISATPPWNFVIRNNIFMGLSTIAVRVTLLGGMILDNTFMVPDAVNGEAISIDVGQGSSLGCIISGNRAANGMLNAGYEFNPYRDLTANTANAWSMNYRGNSVIEPVGA